MIYFINSSLRFLKNTKNTISHLTVNIKHILIFVHNIILTNKTILSPQQFMATH